MREPISISSSDDTIDSRDIIARIEWLEEKEQEAKEEYDANQARLEKLKAEEALTAEEQNELEQLEDAGSWTATGGEVYADTDDWDEDAYEELQALKELRDEAESLPDWPYGLGLVHEDHFEDYARELAEDIGVISQDAKWPANHIDWEAAADELRSDYIAIKWRGSTYYVR